MSGFPQQLGSRDALELRESMSFGDGRHELVRPQLLVSGGRVHRLEGRDDDRDVEGVGADPVDELGDQAGTKVDLHIREPVLEGLQDRSCDRRHPEDGGPHPQRPPFAPLGELWTRHRSIRELDRLTGMVQEDAARLGELDASAIAAEELDTDGALELQDLLRETGLGDVEAFRRSPEVEFLGHDDEVPELTEIYRCHRSGPPLTVAPTHIMARILQLCRGSCQLTRSHDIVEAMPSGAKGYGGQT